MYQFVPTEANKTIENGSDVVNTPTIPLNSFDLIDSDGAHLTEDDSGTPHSLDSTAAISRSSIVSTFGPNATPNSANATPQTTENPKPSLDTGDNYGNSWQLCDR